MKNLITLTTILSFCASFLFAQDDKNKWTPEDIINTEYVRSTQFSPDNNMIVWTKRKGVKEKDKFVSDIYLTRLDVLKKGDPLTVQLTNQDENDTAPFFSKDGATIYFQSTRDKGKKLWSMSIYGGEPLKVHDFEDGISNIQWLNDSTFAYISNDGKTLYENQLKEKKDNTIVVEDSVHWTTNRVYSFDVKKKTTRRLTQNNYPVSGYNVSRDGQWMIYWQTMSRHYASDANPDQKFYLKNLTTGNTTEILQGLQTPYNFQFTADNQGFYFVAVQSSNPEWNGAGVSLVHHYSLTNKQHSQVDLKWALGMEGSYQVIGQDIMVTLANGATDKLTFYKKNGNAWAKSDVDLGDKNEHVMVQSVSDDFKKVLYEHSTAAQLPRYYVADLKVSGNSLTFNNELEFAKVNKKLKSKPITKREVFKWTGAKGEEVNGLLYYPEDYVAGKRYPLMLSIHGGPAGVDMDRWRERWSTYPQIIAQRGAFVLKPNYHGSSNHGQEFVESIKKKYYDLELEDITNGIEALHNRGLVDKAQMGVMGWSNGAILATMLTVRYPDMFKVACPGAGDVNWTSDYGTCRFGVSFDQSYFGGAPWDDVNGKYYNEEYIRFSPLFEMEKVKTPTIIFHGSEDRAVPRDQGWEYYRALQQVDKAPVRFLWFPDQPHGLQKITHQLRKMKEELAWIDHYFFGKKEDKNEALKEDSPLALLLKKEKAAAEKGLFGQHKANVLVPEVVLVKKDSISIGRFEVTNAQLKAFDAKHLYPASEGNFPARVSFKQAEAYVQWLSQKTGEKYRLPNAKEAKDFHQKAHKTAAKENSLNHWAGYEITKDEVALLSQKLADSKTSLLKDVGHFKASKVGEAEVYDLGGNVAEYSADGKTYGYSAYDYVDPHSDEVKVKEGQVGFRVVKQ